MPFSAVQIANMALSHVGDKSTIESLTERSPQARVCNLWYDLARQESLEAYDWNIARKRRALAAHADDPPCGIWTYRYQFPEDCLAPRFLANPTHLLVAAAYPQPELTGNFGNAVPYSVEISDDGSRSILTNMPDAILVYTFDQVNPSYFSAALSVAMSHSLARHIAFALTGSLKVQQTELQIFQALIKQAAASNANQSVAEMPREAEWVRGRV